MDLKYNQLAQGGLDSSEVKGSPQALAVVTIPLLLGIVGFTIGYFMEKLINKRSQQL